MEAQQLFYDNREITRIVFEDGETLQVGKFDVTKIEAYKEAGECGYVPWFAIHKGDTITDKVNAKFIAQVSY
jgi:hypothetical protein